MVRSKGAELRLLKEKKMVLITYGMVIHHGGNTVHQSFPNYRKSKER